MKKSLILLPMAAVLLSLTGCKKDNEKSGPSGDTVTLSATLGGGEKTEIDDNLLMKWSAGDAVVINGKEYEAKFPVGDYTKATFENVKAASEYKAYYPTRLYTDGVYKLPATQTYRPENSDVLSGVNPMYAVTATNTLRFHNICSLVKLDVTGNGVVKTITVSSSDKALWGTFTVSESESGRYYAVITDGPSADNKVLTLDCGEGVQLYKTTARTFYIALPEGVLGNLTFTCKGNGDEVWTSQPIATATLEAGKLYIKELNGVKYETVDYLPGVFTVGGGTDPGAYDDVRVLFSKGNLQYVNETWQFAANQWDCLGAAYSAESWDLFGWSTSATNYGMNTSQDDAAYSGEFEDWGIAYCGGQGTPSSNTWRTLTKEQWEYLFNVRTTTYVENRRYAEVKVNGMAGILLFPDDFSWPSEVSKQPTVFNTFDSNWNGVDYNIEEFSKLEAAGCVFLPAAGYRSGTSVSYVGSNGSYWSSTPNGAANAYSLYFSSGFVTPAYDDNRYYGLSVRLVLPVEN